MISVFFLNVGRLLNFDLSFATKSVELLQEQIALQTAVPVGEQILLISGGVVLCGQKNLSSYTSAGTESNPIFFVSRITTKDDIAKDKQLNDREFESIAEIAVEADNELQRLGRTTRCSREAVTCCINLAKRIKNMFGQLSNACFRMFDEQHLVYQGWCAVVANLDDTLALFRKRIQRLVRKRERLANCEAGIRDLLAKLPEILETMKRVPIVEPLVNCKLPQCSPGAVVDLDLSAEKPAVHYGPKAPTTLFCWIDSLNEEINLYNLREQIQADLDYILNPAVQKCLENWAGVCVFREDDLKMKKIKGIALRFQQLEGCVEKMKELVTDVNLFCEFVCSREEQMRICNDASVLEGVYGSIINTLSEMMSKQKATHDTAVRFCEAKAELLDNIRRRLDWVHEVHEYIQNTDREVFIHRERMYMLHRRLDLLKQIRLAPVLYASSVVEIKRRTVLRNQFLDWARQVSEKAKKLFTEETQHRKNIALQLERHFLRALFPCLDSPFPAFAMDTPESVDSYLPSIEDLHIEQIRTCAPELSQFLQLRHRAGLGSTEEEEEVVEKVDCGGKVVPYGQTPPLEEGQRSPFKVATNSPSFFHSMDNISGTPSRSLSSLNLRSVSEIEICEESLKCKESGIEEKDCLPTRSTPITVVPRTCESRVGSYPICCSRAVHSFEPLSRGGGGGDGRFEMPSESEAFVQRNYKVHPLSPDFISVSPCPTELQENMLPQVGSASSLTRSLDMSTPGSLAHRKLVFDMKRINEELNSNCSSDAANFRQRLQSVSATALLLKDSLSSWKAEVHSFRVEVENELHSAKRSYNEQMELLKANLERSLNQTVNRKISQMKSASKRASQSLVDSHCQVEMELVDKICETEQRKNRKATFSSTELLLPIDDDDADDDEEDEDVILKKTDNVHYLKETYEKRAAELKAIIEKMKEFGISEQTFTSFASFSLPSVCLSNGSGSLSTVFDSQSQTTYSDQLDNSSNDKSSVAVASDVSSCVEFLLSHVSYEVQPERIDAKKVDCSTQTKLDCKISVVNIEPGDIVLVVFEPKIESFVVFCLPSTIHVLTESSIKHLDLSKDGSSDQGKWNFGRVIRKQHCQAKKESNRYKLPAGSRFYRVTVEPIGARNEL
ncbi:RB1-inducible coiled-coil protein 1 [Trichinella zimbabwensis]|uniref:RB1-inducible coiled-coil protein 1 n=1 Tax=Trichinella zimbabwensis TaxID=268475 RepID=A0A0V1I479_9BILA|nr:RB1-inducible coiled-coil protein 1 [Trichinella zimbabwensis]